MENGIVFEGVNILYQDGSFRLQDINLEIARQSFLGITGVNGSGKTTLTYLINGLIPKEIRCDFKGKVWVDGVSTRERPVSYFAGKVGMVFQNPDFMLFNLTVREEVEFGLKKLKLEVSEKIIDSALREVGMLEYKNTDPRILSFGQKQKVCLASVLAQNPSYIILDEPTAMLDYRSSVALYEILKKLNRAGKTIIIVEHDTDFLAQYANRIIVMDGGKIILDGAPKSVFRQGPRLRRIGIKIPRPFI